MKVFWHQSDNFGDKLTPYLLSKLGIPFEYAERQAKEEHYIMCGSILTACNEHSIIWGAGIAQPFDLIPPKKILAVRGKKTRDFLLSKGIDCPEVYGDPAMLLPLLYKPYTAKQRKVGIIPHIIDRSLFSHGAWDLNREVEQTIDYIRESEMIISSSLHALITAHAYGIPYQWIRSTNVIGNDFKFYDFFETDYNIEKFIQSFPIKNILNDTAREI
jgi:pyruvyltransferase